MYCTKTIKYFCSCLVVHILPPLWRETDELIESVEVVQRVGAGGEVGRGRGHTAKRGRKRGGPVRRLHRVQPRPPLVLLCLWRRRVALRVPPLPLVVRQAELKVVEGEGAPFLGPRTPGALTVVDWVGTGSEESNL